MSTRSVKVVRPAGADGVSVVAVTALDLTEYYLLCRVPSAIGGTGYHCCKLGNSEPLAVLVHGPDGSHCECVSFLSSGSCRHVSALEALLPTRAV